MSCAYISDTNIWIDFRHADLLDALFQLPFDLCSTDFVLAELDDIDTTTLEHKGLIVVKLTADEVSQLGTLTHLHRNSSLADVSCYFLARQSGQPLLTGDGQLRKQALKDGLLVHGALWLLDQLLEQNIIDTARAHAALTTMLSANARLPKHECDARLTAWLPKRG